MNTFTGVFFHVNPRQFNVLGLTAYLNGKATAQRIRMFKLGNLIPFRKIWIKIMLSRPFTDFGNRASKA